MPRTRHAEHHPIPLPDGPLICPYNFKNCFLDGVKKVFPRPADYRRHVKSHDKNTHSQCRFCGARTAQAGNLRTHMKALHKEVATNKDLVARRTKKKTESTVYAQANCDVAGQTMPPDVAERTIPASPERPKFFPLTRLRGPTGHAREHKSFPDTTPSIYSDQIFHDTQLQSALLPAIDHGSYPSTSLYIVTQLPTLPAWQTMPSMANYAPEINGSSELSFQGQQQYDNRSFQQYVAAYPGFSSVPSSESLSCISLPDEGTYPFQYDANIEPSNEYEDQAITDQAARASYASVYEYNNPQPSYF